MGLTGQSTVQELQLVYCHISSLALGALRLKADLEGCGNTAQKDGSLPPASDTGGLRTPHYGLSRVVAKDRRPQGCEAQTCVTYREYYEYFISRAAAGEMKSHRSVYNNKNV